MSVKSEQIGFESPELHSQRTIELVPHGGSTHTRISWTPVKPDFAAISTGSTNNETLPAELDCAFVYQLPTPKATLTFETGRPSCLRMKLTFGARIASFRVRLVPSTITQLLAADVITPPATVTEHCAGFATPEEFHGKFASIL